jgi:diadenosine tetraphosphatase ApaH/serine/threonine PP2A family protein phosphatase
VDLIREKSSACVIGNHDWAALDRPGINVDDFNPHARFAVLWTREQLSAVNRTFLDSLSDQPIRPMADESVIMTHASPREPVWEYILAPSTALENFMEFDEEICLVGHTHKPAIFAWQMLVSTPVLGSLEKQALASLPRVEAVDGSPAPADLIALNDPFAGADTNGADDVVSVTALQPQPNSTTLLRSTYPTRLIINPGSVGQPRDNDARASYAILDLEHRTWRYDRVAYPIELTQAQMREAHLPRRLIDRLSFGW